MEVSPDEEGVMVTPSNTIDVAGLAKFVPVNVTD